MLFRSRPKGKLTPLVASSDLTSALWPRPRRPHSPARPRRPDDTDPGRRLRPARQHQGVSAWTRSRPLRHSPQRARPRLWGHAHTQPPSPLPIVSQNRRASGCTTTPRGENGTTTLHIWAECRLARFHDQILALPVFYLQAVVLDQPAAKPWKCKSEPPHVTLMPDSCGSALPNHLEPMHPASPPSLQAEALP